MTRVAATCHCGAIEIEADLIAPVSQAKRCNCSFCKRRQAANVSAAARSLRVLQGAEDLTLYQWGTGTARHYFCRVCGIYTHHRRRTRPDECGINIGCIHGVNPADFEPVETTDGAGLEL